MSYRGPRKDKEKKTKPSIFEEEPKPSKKKGKPHMPKGEMDEGYTSNEEDLEESLEEDLSSKVGFLIKPEDESARKKEFALKEMHKRAKKLQKLFAKVFPEAEWDRTVDKEDGSVTYTNKTNNHHKIIVEEEKNDIRFSGTPIEKLIEATAEFEKNLPGMTYEVEAETLDDAIVFMQMLRRHGFDLHKITDIKSMNGKELTTKEGNKIGPEQLKNIIAEIERTVPKKESEKRPSPGLSGRKQSED